MLSLHVMLDLEKLNKIFKVIPLGVSSVIVLVLIAYLSLDRDPFDASKTILFPGADKVIHGIMYFTLSVVFCFDYIKQRGCRPIKTYCLCICALVAFAYSVLMEYLQGIMDIGRSASIYDAIANFVGALLGLIFMKCVFLARIYDITRLSDARETRKNS